MDAYHFPFSFDQCFVITQRLCTNERAKRQPLGWNIHIFLGFGCDLDEQSILDAAFMELSRRMLETRTKASGHRIAGFCTDGNPHRLQRLDHFAISRQIGIDGNIPTRFSLFQETVQNRL